MVDAQARPETTSPPVSRALVVLICLCIAVLEGYDIQAFGVVAPKLVSHLGLSAAQQGWAASAAMIGLAIGAFTGGWLSDRIGRKPVLLVSTIGFGLFSIATALSPSYEVLLLARFAAGLGFGGAMPNLIAIATEISRPERRALTVTTMFCGLPIGGTAVSLLVRAAGEDLTWQTVFIIGGALPLLLAPVIFFLLPETRRERPAKADRAVLRTLFGERRAVATVLLWVAYFLTLLVLYLMLNWLPTLIIAKGFAAADGATASLWFNLAGIAGALLVGFVVDRSGFCWPVTLCYVLLALVMAAMAATQGLSPVLMLSGVAGFLVLGAQFTLYATVPMFYPPQVRALGAGAAVAMGRLGSIVGPLVAGELRQAGSSAGSVFNAMVPVILAAAAAIIALRFLGRPHRDG